MAGLACAAWLALAGCRDAIVAPPQSSEPPPALAGRTGAGASGTSAEAGRPSVTVNVNVNVLASPPAVCGATQCLTPPNVAGQLLRSVAGVAISVPDAVGCCIDASKGVCGSAEQAGVPCDVPAKQDAQCPGVDLSALAAIVDGLGEGAQRAMIGCCTHRACGLDGVLFGRGCVENADAKRMLSVVPLVGPLIDVPPPSSCNSGDADADAGI